MISPLLPFRCRGADANKAEDEGMHGQRNSLDRVTDVIQQKEPWVSYLKYSLFCSEAMVGSIVDT